MLTARDSNTVYNGILRHDVLKAKIYHKSGSAWKRLIRSVGGTKISVHPLAPDEDLHKGRASFKTS